MSIDRFLRKRPVEDLEMKDIVYFVPEGDLGQMSEIYCFAYWSELYIYRENLEAQWCERAKAKRLESTKTNQFCSPHLSFRGGHGLVSTAKDYLNFCIMLIQQGEWNG